MPASTVGAPGDIIKRLVEEALAAEKPVRHSQEFVGRFENR